MNSYHCQHGPCFSRHDKELEKREEKRNNSQMPSILIPSQVKRARLTCLTSLLVCPHLTKKKVQRRHPLRRAQPRLPRKVMPVRNQPLHEVINTRIPALRTDSHHIGRNVICCKVQQGPWQRSLCHSVRCPRQIMRAVRLQDSRTPTSYIVGQGGRWHDCPVVDSPFRPHPFIHSPLPGLPSR